MLTELFAQHPLPWSLGDLDDVAVDDEAWEWRQQIVDANGTEIAATYGATPDEAILLAHAIAALPDLIKASKATHALIDRLENEWYHTTEEGQQLRAALAKAGVTGEE